jgi:hypothetical protein
MKHGLVLGVLFSLLFAIGCSRQQQVRVTYRSDPPGGTLYKLDGGLWGQCPKVLYYDIDQEDVEKGYLDVKGLMVKWPSGPAKKSGELIRITVDGTNRQVTFIQPEDTPASSTVETGDSTDQ